MSKRGVDAKREIAELRKQLGGEHGEDVMRNLRLMLAGHPTEPTFEFRQSGSNGGFDLGFNRGIVYVRLPPSEGLTGRRWIRRFGQTKTAWLTPDARAFLASDRFSPEPAGTVHTLAIIPRRFFTPWGSCERYMVSNEARNRNFRAPHPEVACLIAESFHLRKMRNWLREARLDSLSFLCGEGYVYLQDRRQNKEPKDHLVVIGSFSPGKDSFGGEMGIGDGFVWEV